MDTKAVAIGIGAGMGYMERLKEKRAKDELIPKIVEILQRFKCERYRKKYIFSFTPWYEKWTLTDICMKL